MNRQRARRNENTISFSGVNDSMAAICNGQVDPYELGAKTLASRGFDVNGNWINFDAAKKYDYFQNQNK